MKRVILANSDLEVSQICLGCWQFTDGKSNINWDPQDSKVSCSIVDKCFEVGVNFFDTAEGYCEHASERVLGKALQGRRRDAIIATKFGTLVPDLGAYTAEDIEKSLNESLRSLQTDYVDLYQVHVPMFVADMKETVTELKRQQALGKIRYYAVSNFGPTSMKEFHEAGGVSVTNQLPYNLLWRNIEFDIVDGCERYNMDILAYSPLQQGLLTGKFSSPSDVPEGRRRSKHFHADSTQRSRHGQEGAETETFQAIAKIREICENNGKLSMASTALSWLLAKRRVVSVIVGASRPEQMVENCKVLELGKDVVAQLDTATEQLKQRFGNNPDMWANGNRVV